MAGVIGAHAIIDDGYYEDDEEFTQADQDALDYIGSFLTNTREGGGRAAFEIEWAGTRWTTGYMAIPRIG